MAPLLVYCLMARRDADQECQNSAERTFALPTAGVLGAPLLEVETPALSVLVSELTESPRQVAEHVEELLCFQRVVGTLSRERTVLPVRFGTLYPSTATLVDGVTHAAGPVREALAEVRGCDEFSIRLLLESEAPSESRTWKVEKAASGRSFLDARRAALQAQDGQRACYRQGMDALRAGVQGHCVRMVEEGEEGRRRLLGGMPSLHCLVKREEERAFREAYRGIEAVGPVRRLLSGPWPVYHFCPDLSPFLEYPL